jgi:hypothetical protein
MEVTAYEFGCLYKLVRMDDRDLEWFKWKTGSNANDGSEPVFRGRPKDRYLLGPAHKLRKSHILVRKVKWGVPVLAGAPPPRDAAPGRNMDASGVARRRREHAQYMLAMFKPWSDSEPLVYVKGEVRMTPADEWAAWEKTQA